MRMFDAGRQRRQFGPTFGLTRAFNGRSRLKSQAKEGEKFSSTERWRRRV